MVTTIGSCLSGFRLRSPLRIWSDALPRTLVILIWRGRVRTWLGGWLLVCRLVLCGCLGLHQPKSATDAPLLHRVRGNELHLDI